MGTADGEKGKGEEPESEADDGGVVDVLEVAVVCEGRCTCDGGRGMGTRAECVVGDWGEI